MITTISILAALGGLTYYAYRVAYSPSPNAATNRLIREILNAHRVKYYDNWDLWVIDFGPDHIRLDGDVYALLSWGDYLRVRAARRSRIRRKLREDSEALRAKVLK